MTKHKAIVRIRWRTRMRYRWHRIRIGHDGRAYEDALNAEMQRRVLYG